MKFKPLCQAKLASMLPTLSPRPWHLLQVPGLSRWRSTLMVLLLCREEPFHALHGAEQGKGQTIPCPHVHPPPQAGNCSPHGPSTPAQGPHSSEWPGQCLAWPVTPKMFGSPRALLGMLECRLGAPPQTQLVAKELSSAWDLISRLPCGHWAQRPQQLLSSPALPAQVPTAHPARGYLPASSTIACHCSQSHPAPRHILDD